MVADHRAEGRALWERFNEKDPRRRLWYLGALTSAHESRAGEHTGLDGLAAELRAGHHRIGTRMNGSQTERST